MPSNSANTRQRQMPMIGTLRPAGRAPAHLVALCRSSAEALRLSLQLGKRSQRHVADLIGMDPAQLSRVLAGVAHFPADMAGALAEATGNTAWAQWVAGTVGCELTARAETLEQRIVRLEVENAELRATAGVAA